MVSDTWRPADKLLTTKWPKRSVSFSSSKHYYVRKKYQTVTNVCFCECQIKYKNIFVGLTFFLLNETNAKDSKGTVGKTFEKHLNNCKQKKQLPAKWSAQCCVM